MATAPVTVDLVVGRHHRRRALVDAPAEVGEVEVPEVGLVDPHVDPEARVLHRVARVVLDAGHHVPLRAPHQGGAHLAEQVGVLAVGLLGPAPRRVAQQVDADAAEEVGALGPGLDPDGVTDLLLQAGIERRAPGHRHGERRRAAHDHAARAVGEGDAGDAPRREAPGHDGRGVVALGHLEIALQRRAVTPDEVQQLEVGQLADPCRDVRGWLPGGHRRALPYRVVQRIRLTSFSSRSWRPDTGRGRRSARSASSASAARVAEGSRMAWPVGPSQPA